MIKIDFEIAKDDYTLRDAIYLSDDHGLSEAEIDAMKQARFDAWYAIVTAPNDDPEVTE